MFKLENTRRNRNFLRLAALASVVFLVTMFGESGSSDQADYPHPSAAADVKQPAEFQYKATQTQTRSAGGQNSQLSLMIFRSN